MAADDDLSAQAEALAQRLMAQQPVAATGGSSKITAPSFTGLLGEALGGGPSGTIDMTPEQQDAAGRRALLGFGMNMLASSGYSPVRRTLGETIAQGLSGASQSMAGTESAYAAALGRQQDLAQKRAELHIQALKEAIPLLTMQQQQRAVEAMRRGAPGTTPGTSIAGVGSDYLTGDKAKDLPLIAQHESGGDPTALNYVAKADPSAWDRGATATGKYQIVASTWREGMQLAGLDPKQYAEARQAPEAVQDKVASALYDKYGNKPWQRGARDWVKGDDGKYTLQTVTRPAAAPASAAAPAAPAAPPGAPAIQMGGPPPAPPSASPGAATTAYRGGGIGDALNPPAPVARKGTPIPAGNLQTTGRPPGVAAVDTETPAAFLAPVQTAGPGVPTGTQAPSVELPPQAGWGSRPGSYGDGAAAPAAPPATPVPVPPATHAEPTPPAPADFKMRPLTPSEERATSYDLDPATQEALQRRKAGALNVEQMQAILKDQADAIAARRKDADAARLKIEETERKRWEGQTHPATDVELERAGIPRQPGVQYLTDNQGQVSTKAVPIDPRMQEFSKQEMERYQKNYATPYDNIAPMRAVLSEMDALKQLIERDKFGGQGGIGADYARRIQQTMSALGLSSEGMKDSTAAQEAYNGLSSQLILKLKAASGTSLGQMSDRDLTFIQSAAPTLSLTPRGREIMTAALRQIFDHQSRVAETAGRTIHDPGGGYTLRDLPKNLDALPDAIPTSPGPSASVEEAKKWRDANKMRRGTAYYGADGGLHLWGVPEPQQ